jgi:hypothetical protein
MPVVPVAQNRVGIASVTDAKLQPGDFSGNAFDALGQGMQRLGEGGQDLAKMLEHQEAIQDQAATKQLDNEATLAIRNVLWTGDGAYFTKQGSDALNAREPTQKALQKIREDMLGRVTSDRQRKMLTDQLDRRLSEEFDGIARYSLQQNIKYEQDQSVSRQAIQTDEAVRSFEDPVKFESAYNTGLGEIRSRADIEGWSPERLKIEESDYSTGIHGAVTMGLIDKDPTQANAYFQQHRDKIDYKAQAKLEGLLREPLERRADMAIADAAMNPGEAAATEPKTRGGYSDPLRGAGKAPVRGGEYGAARDYGGHQGDDWPAPVGTAVYSGHGAGVAKVSRSRLGGNTVTIDHGDGVVTRYMHLSAIAVQNGQRVDGDTPIGQVGVSGRSTGPHLHYEARVNGRPVDPGSLVTHATRKMDPAPGDLGAALANVDADPRLANDPVRRERVKSEVIRRFGVADAVRAKQTDAARDDAWQYIDRLPENGFTSYSQLPSGIRARLDQDPSAAHQFHELADATRASLTKAPKTNPMAFITMSDAYARDPAAFLKVRPEVMRTQLDDGDFNIYMGWRRDALQDKTGTGKTAKWNADKEVLDASSTVMEAAGLTTTGKKEKERAGVAQSIAGFQRQMVGWAEGYKSIHGKPPPAAEIRQQASRYLVQGTWRDPTTGAKRTDYLFNYPEKQGVDLAMTVPADVAARIRRQAPRATDADVTQIYISGLGKHW